MKGVLLHKPVSAYDDDPSTRYHFPVQYKKVADRMVGDWVLFYEPGSGARHYKAVAKAANIVPDTVLRDKKHFYLLIEPGTYLDFARKVSSKRPDGSHQNSNIELAADGKRAHLVRTSLRLIPDKDFWRIVKQGTDEVEDALKRIGLFAEGSELQEDTDGFTTPHNRPTLESLLSRPLRDRNFRANVLRAYSSRCAFTGFSFKNSNGIAEIEAAHIRPVSEGGSDSTRNGLALSRSVHWMFDQGLLGLASDGQILLADRLKESKAIARLIPNLKATLPKDPALRPHPASIEWHRTNVFLG